MGSWTNQLHRHGRIPSGKDMVREFGLNRRRNFRLCAGPSRAQQNTEAMRIGDAGLVRPPNGAATLSWRVTPSAR
jgi:hypothetical protein